MRLEILTGARVAHPRSVQYACCSAQVVRVSRVTHVVEPTQPHNPGVTRRAG
jgi:hypothetical protein